MNARGSRLHNRIIAALLSVVLATSGIPTSALAEGAHAASGAGEVAQATSQASEGPDAGAAASGEQANASSNSGGEEHGGLNAALSVNGGAEDSGALANSAGNQDEKGGGLAKRVVPQMGSSVSAARAPQANAASADSVTTVPTAVQVQKDGSEVSSYTSVSVGDTFTAVPGTDGDSYWDDEFTPLSSADAAQLSYQWYRGSSSITSSYSPHGSYTAIAGATSATYTATDADTGSYLAATVTYNGNEIWSGSSTGVVKAAGAVTLGSVELAGSANIGSTLTAKAYGGSSWNKQELPAGTKVTYVWRYSDSKPSYYGTDWTSIEGVTGNTLTLTDAYKGKYISVTANAGDNTIELSSSDAIGPVLAEGETQLDGVRIKDAPDKVEVGDTLTAEAYTGGYYNQKVVTDNVTYTWRYGDSSSGPWTDIKDQTGATYTVDDSVAGKYLSVTANAGANTIELSSYSVVGPVKLQGEVEIYSASTTTTQDSKSSTTKYRVGDTIWTQAKEEGSNSNIDPSKLDYQWQVSDDNSTWADIEGATNQSFTLDDYTGRYVRCHISSKVGTSSYDTRSRNKVAAADVVDVQSVTLSNTGALQVGDTLTATAKDQDSRDVTNDPKVTWQWYVSDTTYGDGEPIAGATGSTLTITDDLLNKYVSVGADGSAGAWGGVSSSKAGPVKIAGAVALDHVEASGKAVIGGTVTAQAYTDSYTKASASDIVHYQWQYASTNTTSDSAFQDIPGATEASWIIPENFTDAGGQTVSLMGKYLRVRATSDGSVVSTVKKSYYGPTSVDPLGPVSVEGAYDLSSVELSSDRTNAQVGATLSAKAQYLKKSSYGGYEADVPEDAKVTYTWYQADDATGTNKTILKTEFKTGPEESTLTLSNSQSGRYVWVEAGALMKPAASDKFVVADAGSYDLHHVNLSPSSDSVLSGTEVSAAVYAARLGSSTNTEVTGRDGVTIQWYTADSAEATDSEWTALAGATGAKLTVPDEAAGKYLRVVATSGTKSVSATFTSPVVAKDSLEGAKALLDQNYGWRPTLTYGTDTNINDVLKSALKDKGFDTSNLSVKVKSVSFRSSNESARVGISTENSDHNGDISYFYVDPAAVSSWDVTSLRTVGGITFELSRDGETVEYTPSRTFQIPWDEAALKDLLQKKADEIALGYAEGDSAESVTGNLTLPYKAGTNESASWASVKWDVPDDQSALSVSGYGWSDYTGKVTRGSADVPVTLTATVTGSSNYDMPDSLTATRDFSITVKADPEKTAQEIEDLQTKLDNGFTYENVTDFSTNNAVDHDAVTADLQMPRPRTLGVDGKYYDVTFSADNGAISFNGYHGIVVRPLDADKTVQVTCTVTNKQNPEITASRTLAFTVAPVSQADLDAEVSLLQKVQAAYKDALLGAGSDSTQTEPVTSNLATFQKAYLDENGNLVFARSAVDAQGHEGIVPIDLPGYDSMGSYDQARLFKSSNTSVVLNETLQLAWNADRSTSLSLWHEQPYYNTEVAVSSKLASERFGAYYAQYKDDPNLDEATKAKLLELSGSDASATIEVAGTSGKKELKVSGSAVGEDAEGQARTWASSPATTYSEGTTAQQVVESMLSSAGLSYETAGSGSAWRVTSVTKNGRTVREDVASGKRWQLLVNGAVADSASYAVQPGDAIELIYSVPGEPLPTPVSTIRVTASVVGQDANGYGESWADAKEYSFDEDQRPTVVQVVQDVLDSAGLSYETTGEGADWGVSSVSKDGRTLGNEAASGKRWQLYVNGKALQAGAADYALQEGDSLTLAYAATDAPIPNTSWVTTTVSVTGEDANGQSEAWAPSATYTLPQGSTARVAIERLLSSAGLSYSASGSGSGYYLSTITKGGRTLGWDESTGKFWQFFVNGSSSNLAIDAYVLQPGDTISLTYSSDASYDPTHDDEKGITASVSLVGEDDEGNSESWVPTTSYTLDEGSTAREAVERLLQAAGLTYEASGDGPNWYLNSITRDGRTLAYDAATGKYWQFYVNGKPSDVGLGAYEVKSGDVLTLAYAAYGEPVPSSGEVNGVEIHPEKERPTSLAADWPSYLGKNGANFVEAPTPTAGSQASENWPQQVLVKQQGRYDLYASDPILVGGKVIVAAGDTLKMLDPTTGKVEKTAQLVTSIDSTCRMIYSDGVIVVPLHAGALQALTADDLTTVWVTPSVDGTTADKLSSSLQQSLSTLTVADGYVYVGTTNAGSTAGSLRRVSLADGAVDWSFNTSDSGYYWCGGVMTDQGLLVTRSFGSTSSELDLMSPEGENGTGKIVSSVAIPGAVRTTVVMDASKKSAYVVSRDGVLYKVAVGDDGSLSLAGSVKFAGYSTSTPTLAEGKLFVGGAESASGAGGIYVVDAATLAVVNKATTLSTGAALGEVKSAPLVVKRGNDLYAYFSAESPEGGLYMYKLGDATVSRLYLPGTGKADYSMSSVVCGADGSLYYTNDSGYLFKVQAGSALPPQFDFDSPAVALTEYGVLQVDDKGTLSLFDSTSGATISSLPLSVSGVAGMLVVPGEAGATVYVVSTDGHVYRVSLGQNGALKLDATAGFASSGSGKPSLVDGRLYVWDTQGTRYALDANTLQVEGSQPGDRVPGAQTGGETTIDELPSSRWTGRRASSRISTAPRRRSSAGTLRRAAAAEAGTELASQPVSSNGGSAEGDGDDSSLSLLDEGASAVGTTSNSADENTGSGALSGSTTSDANGETRRGIPWWPFVGMAVAVVLLVAVALRRKGRKEA